MKLLLGWAINAVALFLLPYIVPIVQVKSFGTALVVALVIALLNTFIRPVLFILTLPITVLTLGLFLLVINAVIILLTDALMDGFAVSGFWIALLFSLLLSLFQSILFSFLDKD